MRLPRTISTTAAYARRASKLVERSRARRWWKAPYVSSSNPVVVGGCGRSGTTLIRVMLDSHPRICAGPESTLFHRPFRPGRCQWLAKRFQLDPDLVGRIHDSSGSQAEFVERFFAEYCRARGKPRWAEKTPRNILAIDYIFEHFPNARFVHALRDGRDAAVSLRTHPRHMKVNGQLVPRNTWNPIDECAQRWAEAIEASKPFRDDPRYIEVRYEELVADPETSFRRLLAWLGEPWDDAVLHHSEVESPSRDPFNFAQNPEATKPVYTSAVGRWRTELSVEDAATVKEIAGDLLVEFGYAPDLSWEPDGGVR